MKWIWIFAIAFLVIMFFCNYNNHPRVFWTYLIFGLLVLTIQTAFIYWTIYKIYSLGRKAFLELNNENLIIISDSKVYIKGVDLFSKKSFLDITFRKPIYDFNQAEILLSETSLILLGRGSHFGATQFAAPVEIAISKAKTSIAQAKITNWADNLGILTIEIKDEYYTRSIKIEFKNHEEEIKSWLMQFAKSIQN